MNIGFVVKNFIFVLKRFKISSLLTIVGLSLAYCIFIVITVLVNNQLNFDKCHAKYKDIYRVDNVNTVKGDAFSVIHPRGFIDAVIQSSPHIKAGTLLMPGYTESYLSLDKDGAKVGIKERIAICYPEIVEIFDFKMLEGSADCLKNPEAALIPKSMAIRLFGESSALEKRIDIPTNVWMKEKSEYLIVKGIYEDFPENTQLNNYVYTAADNISSIKNWSSSNFICYILLEEGTDPKAIAANFNKNIDINNAKENNIEMSLTPLSQLYYKNEFNENTFAKSGSLALTLVLISIGIIIVLIAAINFANFSMALAPMRLKTVTLRKIMGETVNALRLEVLAESLLFSFLSFILALAALYTMFCSGNLTFFNINANPLDDWKTLAYAFLVAASIAFLAGLRPAWYISSYKPMDALKGAVGTAPRGKKMRELLVGFQFFVSIVLVVSTVFVYMQNQFVKSFNLGYNTEQILLIELDQNTLEKNKLVCKSLLLEHPDIEDVSFSLEELGASDNYRFWTMTRGDEEIQFNAFGVSHNFPSLMDINIIEGRSFQTDENYVCIINKSVSEKYNMKVGDYLNVGWDDREMQVVGIMDEIQMTSLRDKSANVILVLEDFQNKRYVNVRMKKEADISSVLRHIDKMVKVVDPVYPYKVDFYDQLFGKLYEKEQQEEQNILFFSGVAILISLMGVFGLVLFENQYRRREVTMRKVLGASIIEILVLFNRLYVRIFLISYLLAIPIIIYTMNQWLENFAYKITLVWWVFLLSIIPVLFLIVLTVSLQSYRTANTNPAEVLKTE